MEGRVRRGTPVSFSVRIGTPVREVTNAVRRAASDTWAHTWGQGPGVEGAKQVQNPASQIPRESWPRPSWLVEAVADLGRRARLHEGTNFPGGQVPLGGGG